MTLSRGCFCSFQFNKMLNPPTLRFSDPLLASDTMYVCIILKNENYLIMMVFVSVPSSPDEAKFVNHVLAVRETGLQAREDGDADAWDPQTQRCHVFVFFFFSSCLPFLLS